MISVGAPVVIAKLYHGNARATAMGVYVTGPYLGGLMALAITNSVVMPMVNGNWRGVMVVYGGLWWACSYKRIDLDTGVISAGSTVERL